MGWTVYNSDGKILQSAELGDNAVTSAKIADGAILNADINASAAIDATKIADGSVTSTEFQYINTLSSNVQTQIGLKAALAAPTFTGNALAVTQAGTDDSTRIATTAHVKDVKIDDFTAGDDNTTLDSSTSRHGLLLKLGGGTTNFLRADGSWNAPAGGIASLAADTTPQVGGSAGLDLQAQQLVGNGGTTGIAISSAGAVTMAAQPSFVAKLTTQQANVTGNTILFRSDNFANNQWSIVENRGSGFANGKFTAPVAGLYQFNILIYLAHLTSSNGYWNLIAYSDGPGGTQLSMTSSNPWVIAYGGSLMQPWSLLVELDANDYLYFGGYVYGGSQVVDVEPGTWFTGHLVA